MLGASVLPALSPGFFKAGTLGPFLSPLAPQGMHEHFGMRFGAGWAAASGLCPWFLSFLALVSLLRLGRAAFATGASFTL